MKTSIKDIALGSLLWLIVLLIPYISGGPVSGNVRIVFLTLVYPFILSVFARQPRFIVSQSAILTSAVVSFLIGLIIQHTNQKSKDSMENPYNNRGGYWGTTAALISIFLIVLILITLFIEKMYENKNFETFVAD